MSLKDSVETILKIMVRDRDRATALRAIGSSQR